MRAFVFAVALAACGGPAMPPAVPLDPGGPGVPITDGTPTKLEPFRVVATATTQGLALHDLDGAILLRSVRWFAKIGESDVGDVLGAVPAPKEETRRAFEGIAGHWPDVRVAVFGASGCRGYRIDLYKWSGSAWEADGATSGGYTSAALAWQLHKPTPTITDCKTAYSPRAIEASGHLLAYASCGGASKTYLWRPGATEPTAVDWIEGNWSDASVTARTSEVYVAAHVKNRTVLMRFDGHAWSESALPIGGDAQVRSMSITPRGTLWLVANDASAEPTNRTLFRREAGKEWQTVSTGDFRPSTIVARDESDIWIVAAAPRERPGERIDDTLLHSGTPPKSVVDLDAVTR